MNEKPNRYLFLYTRLPDYFFRCVQHLVNSSPAGSEAKIVCYPQDGDAPYQYDDQTGAIGIIEKKDLATLNEWNPDLIYVSGWGDKDYNRFTVRYIREIPVIIGMDNPWKGTIKQKVASWLAPLFLRKKATHLWISGYPQYEFARRMGFPANRILHDLYCADTVKFRKATHGFRKRILFVGRMVDYKRPGWLAEAFAELLQSHPHLQDWQLLMIGNGPLQEKLQLQYGGVKQVEIRSFMQPAELIRYYHESAVFCMPSVHEHWGVVVQEAAAAGLALFLSDTCGAASTFLINGHNGFVFESLDKEDFKQKLYRLLMSTEPQLIEMGANSDLLSERITPESWCANLRSVLYGD